MRRQKPYMHTEAYTSYSEGYDRPHNWTDGDPRQWSLFGEGFE
jgi:hypothetical protein